MFDLLPPLAPGFYTGLAFASALLGAGLLIGLWLGRQVEANRRASGATGEAVALVGNLWHWARNFAHEVAQYREVLGLFAERMEELEGRPQDADSTAVLHRVMEANERLQERIGDAEIALRRQADELACYMTEARTDALTGLPNRRSFDNEFQRRLAQWRRQNIPFAVLLLDIDRFKQLNDTHGHPAGDAVLSEVGQILREVLEDGEFAARYGGEEFVLILPYEEVQPIAETCGRISDAIVRCNVPFEQQTLLVTVSMGTAAAMKDELGPCLVKRADAALYAAKRNGRNRAYWHDGDRCVPLGSEGSCDAMADGSRGDIGTRHPLKVTPASILRDNQASAEFGQVCADLKRRLLDLTRR